VTDISFIDRVAIVTGAGGGLGRTYALDLAARGAAVVVNDLGGAKDGTGGDASAAQKVVDEIEAKGGRAVASYDSVATPEGGQAIVDAAIEAFGKVDIVINNAGILRDQTFAKLTDDNLNAVLDVHLKGAFNVSRPAFRVMKENGYGRFIFTSSNAGVFGNFGQSNYGAAKMGLVGLSNVLAIEGAKANIKSNVICPLAATRMTEDLLGPLADNLAPDCVTPMVVYLVSEASEYTHEVFSAGANRFSRVFVALAPGWFAGSKTQVTAEDIASNIDQIRDQTGYTIPGSVSDEIGGILELLKSEQ
jgi:NAD(P)-dependent dehydrogenase (short-subunit alcohol dehydrogenase family)